MKKISFSNKLLICCLIFISQILAAEETELRPYKLINADKLIVRKIKEEVVTNLKGNVHFFYGETEFYCDFADIFDKQKIVRMHGNVEVFDDSLSLFADEVDYFRETEKIFLEGNVFAQETHIDSTIRTFEADRVEYFRTEREFYAFDNVLSYDQRENIYGECGRLNYYLNENYGYLMLQPALRMHNQDSLSITAEKIEFFRDYDKVVATFDVKTSTAGFDINSDFLLYFAEEDKAVYLGDPFFYSDFADAEAMEFQVYFDQQKIIRAVLIDSCHVKFKTDETKEKRSWLKADRIDFTFNEGRITLCDATSNVDSYFHQEKTAKRDFAVNQSTGNRLLIKMSQDNKIDTIDMFQTVKGMYKFQK